MIKLSSCQNDPPGSKSFWQNDSLVTLILFVTFMILSSVSNFGDQSLGCVFHYLGLFAVIEDKNTKKKHLLPRKSLASDEL